MGKRNKERIERILAGTERPISETARQKIANIGVQKVQSYSTNNQIKFLVDSLHSGKLSADRLRKTLESNAHKEMAKGYIKIANSGKQPTVDTLLEEYNRETDFQRLAEEVGLDRAWFTNLAEQEITSRQPKQSIEPALLPEQKQEQGQGQVIIVADNKKTGMSLFSKLFRKKIQDTLGDNT